jgi:hypothetical protein
MGEYTSSGYPATSRDPRLKSLCQGFPFGEIGTTMKNKVRYDISSLSEDDLYLFNEGSHFRLYEKLGAHLLEAEGDAGAWFAVWAPEAKQVSVMGDFNGWHNLVVANFTPVVQHNYRVGVPQSGFWKEILNRDAAGLLGQRPGQPGWGGGLPSRFPRPVFLPEPHPAALGNRILQMGRLTIASWRGRVLRQGGHLRSPPRPSPTFLNPFQGFCPSTIS